MAITMPGHERLQGEFNDEWRQDACSELATQARRSNCVSGGKLRCGQRALNDLTITRRIQ